MTAGSHLGPPPPGINERTGDKMSRRNRRKRRMIRLAFLLGLVAAVLAVVFLFRVRKVTVYGNSRHTSDEIARGLTHNFLTENTLYLQWEYRKGTVPDTLPFLNSLEVRMKSPFEIQVTVTEKELAGYIDKGDKVYFDSEGVVLEITDKVYDDLPVVTGADVEEPVLYQKLPTSSSAQLRTILSLTQLLRYQELNAREIRFGENSDITVYVDGVEALLGQDEYLEEKVANLRAILAKMEGKSGTLHLESFTGKNDATTFSVSNETEAQTESGTIGSGDGDGTDGDGAGGVGDGTGGNGDGTGGTGDGTGGTGDGAGGTGDGTGDGTGGDGAGGTGDGTDGSGNATDGSDGSGSDSSQVIAMVFDSTGTLVYNVHISNGTVVDSNGNPVSGCYVNENGYVVDAYMNVIDPATGNLMN